MKRSSSALTSSPPSSFSTSIVPSSRCSRLRLSTVIPSMIVILSRIQTLLFAFAMIHSITTSSIFANSQSLFNNNDNNDNNDNDNKINRNINNLETVSNELFLNSNLPTPTDDGISDTNPNVPDALNSVGIIFNLRSKSNTTIYLSGLEFYTSMKGSIFYELYSKSGDYNINHGDGSISVTVSSLGDLSQYDLVSSGLVDGPGLCNSELEEGQYDAPGYYYEVPKNPIGTILTIPSGSSGSNSRSTLCPLAIVPSNDFRISEEGEAANADSGGDFYDNENLTSAYPYDIPPFGTRTMYLTLASNNLLVRPVTITEVATNNNNNNNNDQDNNSPNSADVHVTVVASSEDLDVYEGLASKTYPFSSDLDSYYDGPMAFMGRIRYRLEVPGKTDVPSSMPSMPSDSINGNTDLESSLNSTNTNTTTNTNITDANSTEISQQPAPYLSYSPTITPFPTSNQPTISSIPSLSSHPSTTPTNPPIKRCRPGRPCLPPPTPPPSSSPTAPLPPSAPSQIDKSQLNSMIIELIVTVENVPDRIMMDREIEQYLKVMTEWFEEKTPLEKNGVFLNNTKYGDGGITLYYHNLLEDPSEKYESVSEDLLSAASKFKGKGRKMKGKVDDGFHYLEYLEDEMDNSYDNADGEVRGSYKKDGEGQRRLGRDVKDASPSKSYRSKRNNHDRGQKRQPSLKQSKLENDPAPPLHWSKRNNNHDRDQTRILESTNTSDSTDPGFVYTYNTQLSSKSKFTYTPQKYPAIYLFTKFNILSNLPYDVVSFFIWDEFKTHQSSLVKLYHDKSIFVSYFRDVSNITVQVVDGLTIPPTASPTKASDVVLEEEEEIAPEAPKFQRDKLFVYVGIILGFLWIFLTLITLRYIAKHRKKARYNQRLNKLQRSNVKRAISRRLSRGDLSGRMSSGGRLASMRGAIFKVTRLSSFGAQEDEEEAVRGKAFSRQQERPSDETGSRSSDDLFEKPQTFRPFQNSRISAVSGLHSSVESHSIA